jgi:glycosyltransferase involved in cell wall biosynthesis
MFAALTPQRRDRWVGVGARALRDLLAEEPADLVLSVSPAFQAHEVVLHARAALRGARWFAWLHDPGAHYMQASGFVADRPLLERWQYRRRAAIEQRVFLGADRMLVTTPELAGVYAAFLPELEAPLVTPCGFDPAEFPSPSPHPRGQKLVIVHVGTIYQQRTPRPIVESLARLRARGRYAPGEVEMEFVGRLENEEGKQLGSIIETLGMSDVVKFIPQVSQAEALRIVRDADVGLVLAPGQPMQVPAKIFEYIGLRRPVLALSDGATSALVRDTGIGYACEQHELDAVLDELLSAWRDGRLDAFGPALDAAARRYDISTIARGLVDEVEREHATASAPVTAS